MPHDCKGRKIDHHDIVKVPVNFGTSVVRKVVGVVTYIYEASTCSGNIRFLLPGGLADTSFNAQDCEIVLKHDGTEPPEAAKS